MLDFLCYNIGAEVKEVGAILFNRLPSVWYSFNAPAVWTCVPPSPQQRRQHTREFSMTLKKSEQTKYEFCRCGCGTKLTGSGKTGYTSGHHMRDPEINSYTSEAMRESYSKNGHHKKGKPHSPEHSKKISNALLGSHLSDERKKKISIAHTGKKLSPEHIKKMVAHQTGKPLPKSHKKSIREALINLYKSMGFDRSIPYPSEWWEARRNTLERDKSRCAIDPSHKSTNNRPDVHHIDGNKTNCSIENLICLCRSCHKYADNHRATSIPRLRALLTERYGYTYG